jgi:hypothetical protein
VIAFGGSGGRFTKPFPSIQIEHMADYLHYWKLRRAQLAFDNAITPLPSLESAWYFSLVPGDRIWVASGDKNGLVLVLRYDVVRIESRRLPPKYATGNSKQRHHAAACGLPATITMPRAIPLSWSILRQLEFDTKQRKVHGTPQSILSGPLTGIKRIDQGSVHMLETLWKSKPRSRWSTELVATSSGLMQPNAEQRRLVEKAAVDAVTKRFEKRGYEVVDKQRENVGYDLLCIKGKIERHVEVKGSSGDCSRFILTANERTCARTDKRFILCTVGAALSKRPTVTEITGARLFASFTEQAISYMMTKRGGS